MKEEFKKIYRLALPYLEKGKMKDFVIHTKGVIRAMELLLRREKGDADILIPAAILHDVGFSKVPIRLQKSDKKDEKIKAFKLHLEYAPPIIESILMQLNYNKDRIKKIIDIVIVHKFKDVDKLNEQLLIDADTLSDSFKEQFYSDAKEYNRTPREHYDYRRNNEFYTQAAKEIFAKELKQRKEEFLKTD